MNQPDTVKVRIWITEEVTYDQIVEMDRAEFVALESRWRDIDDRALIAEAEMAICDYIDYSNPSGFCESQVLEFAELYGT